MSDTTQIVLAIISGTVILGGGLIKLGFSQRGSIRLLAKTVDSLSDIVERFDIVLSGYKGVGGLLLEVEKLREEMATVDERIRTDGKHAAMNACTPLLANLRSDMMERLDDHEDRLRPLERRTPS